MRSGRRILALVLAASLGFAAVVLPPILAGVPQDYASPLFPVVYNSVEHMMTVPTFLGLLLAGLVAGYLAPRMWLLAGVATMAVLPVLSILEMIADFSSHNLIPFELLIYAMLSLIGGTGAWLGSRLHRRRGSSRLE